MGGSSSFCGDTPHAFCGDTPPPPAQGGGRIAPDSQGPDSQGPDSQGSEALDPLPFSQLLAEMDAAHARLLQTLRACDDAMLDAQVAGKSYTNWTMVAGLMHHSTYHAAQIAMLKKF